MQQDFLNVSGSMEQNIFILFLMKGELFAISSKPDKSKYGALQFIHPDFDRITEEEEKSFLHTGKSFLSIEYPKN